MLYHLPALPPGYPLSCNPLGTLSVGIVFSNYVVRFQSVLPEICQAAEAEVALIRGTLSRGLLLHKMKAVQALDCQSMSRIGSNELDDHTGERLRDAWEFRWLGQLQDRQEQWWQHRYPGEPAQM